MSMNKNDIFIGEVSARIQSLILKICIFLTNKIYYQVTSVQNYGAFIRIPGNKQQGLVHRSQLSRVPVDDATDVLSKGDKIWAKVIGNVS